MRYCCFFKMITINYIQIIIKNFLRVLSRHMKRVMMMSKINNNLFKRTEFQISNKKFQHNLKKIQIISDKNHFRILNKANTI